MRPINELGFKKMKKIMIVLTVLMCFASTSVYAQLKEVRGIQTRKVEYVDGYDIRKGYEFKNENNYPVWVEAELWHEQRILGYDEFRRASIEEEGICDTKSFTLSEGETYVWKCNADDRTGDCGRWGDSRYKCYVKYKAYKAE